MADFPAGDERVLRELIGTFRCRVCRRTFDQEQIRLAARHEHLWIISVRCTLCRNQQVFWIGLKDRDAEAPLSDLTPAEEEAFAGMEPLASDDVLDIHEFLAEFDGNFKALFHQQRDLRP